MLIRLDYSNSKITFELPSFCKRKWLIETVQAARRKFSPLKYPIQTKPKKMLAKEEAPRWERQWPTINGQKSLPKEWKQGLWKKLFPYPYSRVGYPQSVFPVEFENCFNSCFLFPNGSVFGDNSAHIPLLNLGVCVSRGRQLVVYLVPCLWELEKLYLNLMEGGIIT